MKYSISAVSKVTGVPVDTLRAWDRRYGLRPPRDPKGRRLYSEEDVLHIQRLREAIDRGHPIGRVASMSNTELVELLSDSPQGVYQQRLIRGFVRDMIEAAVNYDPHACERTLTMATAVLAPMQLVETVLSPVLLEVGERWHREELCVAQERLVSSAVLRQLHLLLDSYSRDVSAPPIVFGALTGERHELGLLMAAVYAASRGIKCLYLGPDIPPAELARFCRHTQARAVACTFVYDEDCIAKLHTLREALPNGVRIFAGGAQLPGVVKEQLPENTAVLQDLTAFGRELEKLGNGGAAERTDGERRARTETGHNREH